MKNLKAIFFKRIFALAIILIIVSVLTPVQILAQQNDENYQEFYNQLSPYGQWIENDNYGYIWIPTAGPDFTPYLSNGYWLFTEYGWTWISNYDWGWATFHYGRWDYNGSYGWFWVPDIEWGPSWVTWRQSNGYYGWAPMRPGVTISVTFGNYNDVPNDRWIFVRDRDIERHDLGRRHVNRRYNFDIMRNSKVIDKTYRDDKRNTTYVAGPNREDVQKIIGRTINPIAVHEKDKPGQIINNDQLQIYRPLIKKDQHGNIHSPARITELKDVKQISQRDDIKQQQKIQKPIVNLPTKINNRENHINRQNTNSANKNINTELPVVNSLKNIDTKNNSHQPKTQNINTRDDNKNKIYPYRQQDVDQVKNEKQINRTAVLRQQVVPKTNSITQQPKERSMNPPINNKNTNQQPRERNMNAPKVNNNTNQQPQVRTMNPPKENEAARPTNSKKKDDKREK